MPASIMRGLIPGASQPSSFERLSTAPVAVESYTVSFIVNVQMVNLGRLPSNANLLAQYADAAGSPQKPDCDPM